MRAGSRTSVSPQVCHARQRRAQPPDHLNPASGLLQRDVLATGCQRAPSLLTTAQVAYDDSWESAFRSNSFKPRSVR